jgi:hypothetical protein
MQNNPQKPSTSSPPAKPGYEAREPRLRNAFIVAASTLLLMFFGLGGTVILMLVFSHGRPLNRMEPLGIIAAPNLQPLDRFPAPHLEIDDSHQEATSLRQQQLEKLNSYGWIDRSQGVVRIPIEQAMQLILLKGLPARSHFEPSTNNLSWKEIP